MAVPATGEKPSAQQLAALEHAFAQAPTSDAYERLAAQVPKMAATWEPGTWSTVGMITFALNPMLPEDMTPGESYDSWICQGCGTPIALARRSPDASPYDMPDGVIRLKCSNCHAQRYYTIHDRRVRPYSLMKG